MERPVLHVIFFDSVGLVLLKHIYVFVICAVSKMETEHGDMVGDLPLKIGDA